MSDFETWLHEALGEGGPSGTSNEALKQEAMRMFDRKLMIAKILTWVAIGLSTAGFIASAVGFFFATSIKECFVWGIIFFSAMELQVLMKLWFWIVHTRISIQKDLKEIQLQLAEHMAPGAKPKE
jgi:hypothetical protein